MLDPQDRTLLRDVLRPPAGFTLDRALLTTFSLDLTALLTVPVAFTVFQLQDERRNLAADPLALLESLRRFARKMTVFCQGGQIYIPKQGQLLLSYLETSVIEVTSPAGGVFHPKLAVLRYVDETSLTPHDSPSHRPLSVLCSSRNLTFDRSWDTMLGNRRATRGSTQERIFAKIILWRDSSERLPDMAMHPPAPDTSVSSPRYGG